MQYRQLTLADIPLIHELLSLFELAFEDSETYGENTRPSNEYLSNLLAQQNVVALVAIDDDNNASAGQVVGGLTAYFLPKFEQARQELYIFELAVAEEYRRRGIASALIDRVCEIATQQGAWVVYVQADREDEAAVALYQKFGPARDVLHFDLRIGQPPGL